MFCSKCGKQNIEGAKFCETCGGKLAHAVKEEKEEPKPEELEKKSEEKEEREETKKEKKPTLSLPKNKRKLFLIVAIPLVLLLVAFCFLFVVRLPFKKALPEKTASLSVAVKDRVDIEIKDAALHLNPYALPEDATVTITKLDKSAGPSETEYPEFKTLAVVDIEPSASSLFLNPDDPGVGPARISFNYPCQDGSIGEGNIGIASQEGDEWILLPSWCNGNRVMADVYHLSEFSLVSLAEDFGKQIIERFKEEFTPLPEKLAFKFLYGKLKSIVFFGAKKILFPLAVFEAMLKPAGQSVYDPSLDPAYDRIFRYFYNLGVVEGYEKGKDSNIHPFAHSWVTESTIPQKTDDEILAKIQTEPAMYTEKKTFFEGKEYVENVPASDFFVDDFYAPVPYARHAYELGFGFGFEQGIYDSSTNSTLPSSEVAFASFYLKDLNQFSVIFSATQGSVIRPSNLVVAEKEGTKLILKDVSQLVLTQSEAGRDFQQTRNDYMKSMNPDLSLGSETGYEVGFQSSDGMNDILDSAIKYISVQSAEYVFNEFIEKTSPSVFIGEEVAAQVITNKKIGDDALTYRVTKPGESGVIYLYFFRKGNIITMLMVGSYNESLTENDADNYARIIEKK